MHPALLPLCKLPFHPTQKDPLNKHQPDARNPENPPNPANPHSDSGHPKFGTDPNVPDQLPPGVVKDIMGTETPSR